MSTTSIIRIAGPSGDADEALIGILQNALKTHLDRKIETDQESPSSSSSSSSSPLSKTTSTSHEKEQKAATTTISNKYFTANLSFRPLTPRTTTSNADATEDGIFLLFSRSTLTEICALTTIHNEARRLDQCGDSLRLCIGVAGPNDDNDDENRNTKEYEERYSNRVLWCLDHGYEYVEADLFTREGIEGGHMEREKDGFARIVEAVEGTVWSCAVMKKKKKGDRSSKKGVKRTRPLSGSLLGGEGVEGDVGAVQDQQQETSVKEQEREEGKDGDDEADSTTATSEKSKDINNETNDTTSKTTIPNPNDTETSPRQQYYQEDEDAQMNNFEQLIKEASRIRAASTKCNTTTKNDDENDGNGGESAMTDVERRQRAGDAAAMMMNLLDQIGFDDDDDDGDSSSDEE